MATRTVRGTLTNEGVECQALRSTTGDLFTLVGNLGGFKAGDRVVVVGTEAEISYCMQGTTLGIISITADAASSPAAGTGSRRDFGRGTYKCLRMGDFILLRAEGTLPNLNSKAELEQLPWRIWPPRFGLFFQSEQIVMPATGPFRSCSVFPAVRIRSWCTMPTARTTCRSKPSRRPRPCRWRQPVRRRRSRPAIRPFPCRKPSTLPSRSSRPGPPCPMAS